jgi:hypothetical protein
MDWTRVRFVSRLGLIFVLVAFAGSAMWGCEGPAGPAGRAGAPGLQGPYGPQGPQGIQSPPGPNPGSQTVWRCTDTCTTAGCIPPGGLTSDRNRCANGMAEDTGLRVR